MPDPIIGVPTEEQLAQLTPQEQEKLTRGTKTLLIGEPGTGKTFSLTTFVEAGLDLFILGTDQGFEESILDAFREKNLPLSKLHYHFVSPAAGNFDTLKETTRRINMMGYADLAEMKNGINPTDYDQFLKLYEACANFKCDRTGEEFGSIDEWPNNRVFAFDSLTGLNKIAMQNFVGGKPMLHQGEWMVVQNSEEAFIHLLCSNLKCFFVLTAHVQKNYNELTGEREFSVDATGAKLGPRLPYMFSDFVVAIKAGKRFSWSTEQEGYHLKNRALPISSNIEPSFVQIVEVWRKRNELISTMK